MRELATRWGGCPCARCVYFYWRVSRLYPAYASRWDSRNVTSSPYIDIGSHKILPRRTKQGLRQNQRATWRENHPLPASRTFPIHREIPGGFLNCSESTDAPFFRRIRICLRKKRFFRRQGYTFHHYQYHYLQTVLISI